MAWLQLAIDLWPILTLFISIVLGAVVLWLRSQFPTKADVSGLTDNVAILTAKVEDVQDTVATLVTDQAAQNARLDQIEKDIETPPTRMELMQAIAQLSTKMSAAEERTESVDRQLRTTNDYLKILIDKGLRE
ncbi:hypothetical protein GO308_09850 [Sphingomonas sp. SFZ2018-12]|uniref:hypothetical protein n=1 Tax=Sphingomonas sp. SFZ2018-12 TaxID=2683197 RepID=UPI001F10A2F1|nr:hypothetical protein [Sphingomonas sp. SFZ2018-12]MCH4893412.1 hypothetical protein [Sphingomonas sp. SFZ2018-12]